MSKLSPAAREALTAVTQRKYCLDPEDMDQLAASIASDVATALRAVAVYAYCPVDRQRLAAIADELEAL